MINTSTAYKNEMKQTLRNHSYLDVSIGIINQMAQSGAVISSTDNMLYLSSTNIFGSKFDMSNTVYASFEEDYAAVNGMAVFPSEEAAYSDDYLGFISEGLCSDEEAYLLVSLGAAYDIKGLTITFADHPIDFEVETDNGTIYVTDNTLETVELTNVFTGISYIRITATEMQSSHRRLKVKNIVMGLGVIIPNKKIKDATITSYVSPISDDVPQVDFNLTVCNSDNKYNADNPDSDINFLETGQNVNVQYGYELEDGTIERFQIAGLKLQSWESNDETAKFTAVDSLEQMDGTYYKGNYYASGISLYDLAVDVLEDAGIESDDYQLDPYLDTIVVNNPMPVVGHKEALQIIANCARCAFLYTADGKIRIVSSFVPDVTAYGTEHSLSNAQNVVTESVSTKKYAFFDNDISVIDGSMTFAPEPNDNSEATFVSSLVSDENGLFNSNQYISFSLEAAYTTYGLTIVFEGTVPEEIRIVTSHNGITVKDITVGDISKTLTVKDNFQEFDSMVVYFTKMSAPYSRARVSYFTFKEMTNYKITKNDLIKPATVIQNDKIKLISVKRTEYELSGTAKQVSKSTYSLNSSNNEVEITFSSPHSGYAVTCDYAVTITEQSAYRVKLSVAGLSSEYVSVQIILTGNPYETSESTVTKQINTTGYTKTWINPLISDQVMATDLCDWLGNYYAADKEYSLSFRGDPALEANDLSYLENDYLDNLICRVYEHSFKYNGAISGTVKARRYIDG